MSNPNAIVSKTIRLEPPLDRSPAEMLRAERGLSVALDGGRRVRLDPANKRSVGYAQVLDGLAKLRRPVYLEIDSATNAIIRILLPLVARVIGVRPAEEGRLDIELDGSHARHILRLSDPDAADLERRLREALKSPNPVILVEDDAHVIMDVRAFTPGPEVPPPPFPPIPIPEPGPGPRYPWPLDWLFRLGTRIGEWFGWPRWWFSCVSVKKAQQVFDSLAATSCDPLTVPPPCIPFLYPDDGCHGRAHEMCRLMIAARLSPQKIWITNSEGHKLRVVTKNNPQCYVEWYWHVAPTLCIRGPGLFQSQTVVIDPALFTTPVSEAVWKAAQHDPGATIDYIPASFFNLSGSTDPNYSATNAILAFCRMALQTRSIQEGPPPYARCP